MSDQSKKLAHELGGAEWVGGKFYNPMLRVYRKGDMESMADLWISFERTVRVSDNGSDNDLPLSLGHFPIFDTSNYEKTLPSPMAAKGGYFLPMHRMFRFHLHRDHVLMRRQSARQCGSSSRPAKNSLSSYTSVV